MGLIETYFWDTYAFYEVISGNKNYAFYAKKLAILTTRLNLMELRYGLLLKFGADNADKFYDKLIRFAIDIDDDIIKSATNLKAEFKNKKLSYIDCIGYTIAKSRGIKFLTGDQQFKDLDNVEFVK